MIEKTVARRYAQALFLLAQEHDQLKQIGKDFNLITESLQSSEELQKIVKHKLLAKEAKKETFRKLFGERVSQVMINFLLFLVDKRREIYLHEIYEEFMNYYNKALNILHAEVKTAFELSEEQANTVGGELSHVTGKDVRVKRKIDPAIIGGIIVRIQDRVFDGSIAGRLEELKGRLRYAETR